MNRSKLYAFLPCRSASPEVTTMATTNERSMQVEEIELKYCVKAPDDFDKLAKAAKAHIKTVRQVNTFFDSDGLDLNSARFTVRLRKEDAMFILGAKSPELKDQSGRQTNRDEKEVPLESEVAQEILEGKADPLQVLLVGNPEAQPLVERIRQILRGKKLRNAGFFVTFRQTYLADLPKVGNQELELDTVIFPGNIVHYEIEAEVPKKKEHLAKTVDEEIQKLLSRAGVAHESGPSKARRFFNIVGGKQG
jgi:uncharacterized protein YjbK